MSYVSKHLIEGVNDCLRDETPLDRAASGDFPDRPGSIRCGWSGFCWSFIPGIRAT